MVGNTDSLFFFYLYGDHPVLGQEELRRRYDSDLTIFSPRIVSLSSTFGPLDTSLFGFVQSTSKFIASASRDSITSFLPHLEDDAKVSVFSSSPDDPSTRETLSLLFSKQTISVNLTNPTHHYYIFWTENKVYLTKECSINKDSPSSRRTHLLAKPHPTAIHPKFAKAMISLAQTDTFHDPFCGVGGIVLEGKRQGLAVSGSDISPKLISFAQENVVDTSFFVSDALALEISCPVLISDLPYGKNSLVSLEKHSLYHSFLHIVAFFAQRLVLGLEAETELTSPEWVEEFSYSFPVHKSLRRKIVLLNRADQVHQEEDEA